ncbi:hypothetical protein BCY91_04355 [Pelobium manganitolerans]|uniref:Haloacid dehalogenase n=1 Tax=Pelobium manganitolerans TaxID=1842495 RepID=A0A419S5Y7_9SPHI|nr:HAD hydrolase-like protein [Pelobium manganitolerans]RKD16126.1 hypothetical protein BCY91_04355 [Pelobium manganitolerans]
MLSYQQIPASKKAVVFDLDDTLIPQKDYDLQVYYLFANFIEYLATFPPAKDMLAFMEKRYYAHGQKGMFEEVQQTFGIESKYQENLKLLFSNAKLPLKLLLFKEALALMQELVVNRIAIFILTAGNAQQQLNKIRQTEWNGLDQYLKVYFADEYQSEHDALNVLMKENGFKSDELLLIGNSEIRKKLATNSKVDFLTFLQA